MRAHLIAPIAVLSAVFIATEAMAQDGTWLACEVAGSSGATSTHHFMFNASRFYAYNPTQQHLRDLCTTQMIPGTGDFSDANHEIICTVSAATLEQRKRWLGVRTFSTEVVIDRSNGRISITPDLPGLGRHGRCRTIDDPRPVSQGF